VLLFRHSIDIVFKKDFLTLGFSHRFFHCFSLQAHKWQCLRGGSSVCPVGEWFSWRREVSGVTSHAFGDAEVVNVAIETFC